MLGVPVGRPGENTFQDKVVEAKVAALEKACSAITGVPDPQLQHCLLRQCLDACKLQFLLRTTPCVGATAQGLLSRADEAILGVVEEMVGGGLHPDARQQASLPFSEGGCGVRTACHVKGPARISSIVHYLLQGRTRVGVPDLAQDIIPSDLSHVLEDLSRILGDNFDPIHGWAINPKSIRVTDPEYARQSWWTDRVQGAFRRTLSDKVAGRDAARIATQTGGVATAWMQIVPNEDDQTRISAADYRMGLRWSLGLPLLSQE